MNLWVTRLSVHTSKLIPSKSQHIGKIWLFNTLYAREIFNFIYDLHVARQILKRNKEPTNNGSCQLVDLQHHKVTTNRALRRDPKSKGNIPKQWFSFSYTRGSIQTHESHVEHNWNHHGKIYDKWNILN
jgi:hypothetical protein